MRESDRVEYEWVFRSAYPSVLRTSYVVLHDVGRAEEIAQDAFLKLYERWRGVVRIDNPQAWVRRVAFRAAIRDAQRTRKRTGNLPYEPQPIVDQLPDLDLARAVHSLPPQQRAAVALFYLEDLPVRQVAELLGISEPTVKSHLHRARAKLAGLLSEREEVSGDVD